MKKEMKVRFKLVCLGNRGGMFYCKDTKTGSRTSLETKDRAEAERLLFHKNEADANPHINRRVGMAYLASSDPELAKRTWKTVKEDIIKDKTGATLHQTLRVTPAMEAGIANHVWSLEDICGLLDLN